MTEANTVTPYVLMGGEAGIRQLVERFYFYMDTLPQVKGIRAMHAEQLDQAKEKLFKYLSGWLGGPDLYIQEYGHPRLRQRHIHFSIGSLEVAQWLLCMEKALHEMQLEPALYEPLWQAINQLAHHMANR